VDCFQPAEDKTQWRAAFNKIINIRFVSEGISWPLIPVGGFWKQKQEKVNIFVPQPYIQKEYIGISAVFEESRICFTSLNRKVCSSDFWTPLCDLSGLGSVESAISKRKQYPRVIQDFLYMGSTLRHYGVYFFERVTLIAFVSQLQHWRFRIEACIEQRWERETNFSVVKDIFSFVAFVSISASIIEI